MDIYISHAECVAPNSLLEVLRKLAAATSSWMMKLLPVKADKPYEAWHLGFLGIKSGAISVQFWIAVFTSMTPKLPRCIFQKPLKCFLGTSLVSHKVMKFAYVSSGSLLLASVANISLNPFQDRWTQDCVWGGKALCWQLVKLLGVLLWEMRCHENNNIIENPTFRAFYIVIHLC